ncbi:hypothetical protein CEXT_381101 [Caerostris extrusa]|uniref:Uncharacterized protein n=1 Tax=Caerostris extrusa TaxID=172846 RepID=A0AAV4SI14_CAEEX|nr:hypothetical protein CEXT_381101 [Caerostris extrusa]
MKKTRELMKYPQRNRNYPSSILSILCKAKRETKNNNKRAPRRNTLFTLELLLTENGRGVKDKKITDESTSETNIEGCETPKIWQHIKFFSFLTHLNTTYKMHGLRY